MKTPIYSIGDIVRFQPNHARYDEGELSHRDNIGRVMDSSDLPNVQMAVKPGSCLINILTADQRDLVLESVR